MHLLHRVFSDVQLMLRRPPRLQYAALCYRTRPGQPLEILLITSRDTGRWVIPKGWPMRGRRAHEVAAREAYEEAGVEGKCKRVPFGHYVYRKRLDSGLKIACKVQIHTMEVSRLRRNFPEKGERRLVWFEYSEAARRVAEPSLRQQILRFAHSFSLRAHVSSEL
ncbi:NUDIX hydrolase (plasmid) [Ensifer adhaerens]|uniref:NUDIX hydrolase n=1 Tax=Ensifer adhaerens TaxID=106592 RepID=UPI0023A95743|nr:NUDIX hydrolase [Ensifer adhaerens]WDZ81874.1 NUDIX hydrolase [Ensifer adhaerens]